ncbi:hypothetical protein VCUG_01964 [Vavraia culicis subsp. floridensis]|uniref:Uncharacterized protein n=1 Tax=Vavraia culicis (isolate floridensis) TaxID=948595 RepID=L2GS92_VAVCU|nr:uncharacterized protein VCUG_01964 [Vavraia culicis subsp. floridensis]ELA46531.1 hypothetical protein VCUG_01964 [Vavraia culicis subsp. floridensis]
MCTYKKFTYNNKRISRQICWQYVYCSTIFFYSSRLIGKMFLEFIYVTTRKQALRMHRSPTMAYRSLDHNDRKFL